MSSDISNTLQERGNRYGEFNTHALITQILKDVAKGATLESPLGSGEYVDIKTNWDTLSAAHREALDMIFHKIGRILNGDPNYKDSWHDISGYAKLGEDACVE